jgi:ComF family protein
VRQLILAMKFGRKHHLAKPLGELLAQRVRDTELLAPRMIVVPAPLTRSALGDRSYNQAEEIALHVARHLALPLETRLLRKVRSTPPQARLTHEQRRKNLKDAFACEPRVAAQYKDRCVLLIDDVITTCSTISECARTLNKAGIGDVRAAAVARG